MKNFFAFVFAVGCFINTNAQTHQQKIDSLLKILPGSVSVQARVDVLNSLAFEYTLISVTNAERFVTKALTTAHKIQYKKGLAESLKILSVIHYVRNEFSFSIEKGYQSLTLYEQLEDKAGQAKVLNHLAMVYNAQKEFQRAYTLSNQSLQLKRQIGDSLGVANAMLSLATYHRNSGAYEMALEFCKAALARLQVTKDDLEIGQVYQQMGEIYHDQKQFSFAGFNYKIALQHAIMADDNFQIIATNKLLGSLLLDSQQFDSAHYYLHKTLTLARHHNIRSHEIEAGQLLAIYFEKINMLDSALFYARALASLEREVFDNQKKEQFATIQLLYDFEKKEQDLNFQKKIVQRQSVAIIGVSLILACALSLGYKFYKLNKNNKDAKEQLQRLNSEIHEMNENLELLVVERTNKIERQNERLLEYAFFTAHEVRGPLARILGLVDLSNLEEMSDEREEIMMRLKEAANELDETIRTINRKLESTQHH